MDVSSGLPLLNHAQIEGSIEPGRVAFCDAHDLVAAIPAVENPESAVTVHRLKGEVAFTIPLRDDEDLLPRALHWKPDGSLLAVTWSDELCCLYSGENGKLLYELPTKQSIGPVDANWTLDVNAQDSPAVGSDDGETDASEFPPPAMIWASHNDIRKPARSAQLDLAGNTDDDLFDVMPEGRSQGTKSLPADSQTAISDLIHTITTLDTTEVLPRLGKIETATGMRYSPEGNKFSTQASTDTIFDTHPFAPGVFSTLLTSNTNGYMSVFMDETIKVGQIQLSSSHQLRAASHQACPSQVVLARSQDEAVGKFELNFVDLPLERLGSPLNYVVSLNTRRLQNLMAYITHTIRCVHHEIQTGIKGVPSRMLKLLEEDLRSAAGETSSQPASLATIELQHLALTSSFHPVVLEWLKDIVKETGHKRWDQAANAMYDHIQSYLFKNVLPALQRFIAAASALRGQARSHQHTGAFVVSSHLFDGLLGWADMVHLVAQRALHAVTAEHAQFRAFSKWLRVMIDVAVAGPGTKGADETEEREAPNYDIDLCLRYIRGPLADSALKVLVEAVSPPPSVPSEAEFFNHPIVSTLSRERTLAAMQTLDAEPQALQLRGRGDTSPLLSDAVNLPLLACVLKAHVRVAIDGVNAWQSQAVPRAPDVVALEHPSAAAAVVWDMAVSPLAGNKGAGEAVRVLSSGNDGSTLDLTTVTRHASSLSSESETTTLDLPPSARIVHAAFLPSTHTHTHPHILALTSTPNPSEPQSHTHTLTLLTHHGRTALHTWPSPTPHTSSLASPAHFLAGGRPGKRVVVVFSSPARGRGAPTTRWEALDLEGALVEAGQRGEGGGMEGDVEMEIGLL